MEISSNQVDGLLRRSQKRFESSISLEVHGKDVSGRVFTTKATLCNASPDGGCIVIDRGLARGQIMRISSLQGAVFPARVCWETYSFRTKVRRLGFRLEGGKNRWFLKDSIERDSETLSV